MRSTGVIVDLETTGINPAEDKIIEIGIIEFIFGDGMEPAIVSSYGSLDDPGMAIHSNITRITGIDAAQLAGQSINWDFVRLTLARASAVIAHNAAFERGFLSARPEMSPVNVAALPWACSMRHIDWEFLGFKTKALNYLAADHGFVNPFPHRALFDCATTFKLVAPHLDEMIARSCERMVTVKAVGSPFETKGLLKERGYRWNGDEKVWVRTLREGLLEVERTFLAESIYAGASRHTELMAVQDEG